jgi:hypothetical protein
MTSTKSYAIVIIKIEYILKNVLIIAQNVKISIQTALSALLQGTQTIQIVLVLMVLLI